jgi:hypothetical protein
MSTHSTIVLAGSLAQKPYHGGHTWVFLQYLLGFKRLGWDVLFLDQLPPEICADATGRPCQPEESRNLHYLSQVMERFGLADSYALIDCAGRCYRGLPWQEVQGRVRDAALLINVMGFLKNEDIMRAARRRIFLDIDPGFGQMWKALGLVDIFQGHDDFVTIGENIGHPDCTVPTCGLNWITSPQPIVLDSWPLAADAGNGRFTTIASWRGAYGPIEYRGRTYGLRVHEFRKFASLPSRCRGPFQLALDIHPAETSDIKLLTDHGWHLVEPNSIAGDPWRYRDFIQASKSEFMVAKNMYVQSNCGWLSDRSLCYLASGKPVLAQDTGLERLYPTGAGLVTFKTLDEAVAGARAIDDDYGRHARMSRVLVEEYFDSDRVLGRLLRKLGVN